MRYLRMKKLPILLGAIALMSGFSASAQEVTLRLHQFLPPVAAVPKLILKPWAQRIETASKGRIKIIHFDAMALGGRPSELVDQVSDGIVDISFTLLGYTPGRFPRSEVFELPFMMTQPKATAAAFWELTETQLQASEFKGQKVLGAWVHGPGVIHSKNSIARLEDLKGTKLRGPTRIITKLLEGLGATAIGMPLPAIPEGLSKGVLDGTVLSWEAAPSIKLTEMVGYHTEFSGKEAFYTSALVLFMNKDKYNALPDDLKAIIDAESGAKLSTLAAGISHAGDAFGRDKALSNGNVVHLLDEAEVARWKKAAAPVVDSWIAEMDARGIDGAELIKQTRALIAKHEE